LEIFYKVQLLTYKLLYVC